MGESGGTMVRLASPLLARQVDAFLPRELATKAVIRSKAVHRGA